MTFELPEKIMIEQVTLDNGFRFYETEIGRLPSVSTVLSVLPAPGLKRWRKKLANHGVDPVKRLQYSAIRGTVIHAEIANHFCRMTGGKVQPLEFSKFEDQKRYEELKEDTKFQEEVDRGMNMFKNKFLEDHEIVPYKNGIEFPVLSRDYNYAGTVDLLAVVDGYITLIDFKTSKAIHDKHEIQVAAYANAFKETCGFAVENIVVVSFPPDIEFLGELVNPFENYVFKNVPEGRFDEFIPVRDEFYFNYDF
ncbi:MAG: PD-(D/E)XK nuclease family protein [Candidatus Hodarchaeales archaeon]|jgi:hypothetical protein